MAYSEIINEIIEQINDLEALIAQNEADQLELLQQIEELQANLPKLQTQRAGLVALQAQAQQLIDNQSQTDININVNVNTTNASGTTVDHSVA